MRWNWHFVDHDELERSTRRPALATTTGCRHTVLDDHPAPDSVGLFAFEGALEASRLERAASTDGLGAGDFEVVVGEEDRAERAVAIRTTCTVPRQPDLIEVQY